MQKYFLRHRFSNWCSILTQMVAIFAKFFFFLAGDDGGIGRLQTSGAHESRISACECATITLGHKTLHTINRESNDFLIRLSAKYLYTMFAAGMRTWRTLGKWLDCEFLISSKTRIMTKPQHVVNTRRPPQFNSWTFRGDGVMGGIEAWPNRPTQFNYFVFSKKIVGSRSAKQFIVAGKFVAIFQSLQSH